MIHRGGSPGRAGRQIISRALQILAGAHGRVVHRRRVRVLAGAIAPLMEPGWHVVDVGCGDGALGDLIARQSALRVEGLEVSVRPDTAIPTQAFDGRRLPLADGAVDAVMLIDVLHHADDPAALLAEARRAARRAVIVKDHRLARPLAATVLRFMDWVGNRPHEVPLPGRYLTEAQWRDTWRRLGLKVDHYRPHLGLYPAGARWLFETRLHFLARLVPEAAP